MTLIVVLDHGDARSIYVQIVDEVRRAIASGSLRASDPLPSIRQLARELRVNPNTVAQAYRELDRLGITEGRAGHGTHVIKAGISASLQRELVRAVAARAVLDAQRHGLDPEDVIAEMRVKLAPRQARA